uniref:Uncharacterized protein n=1 Tax=Vespula pensylvanica TaxID=30213 RepID=A0A834UC59_VESPE|nr:hypothetical protein H0235_006010 [Vespula pensylvanica]
MPMSIDTATPPPQHCGATPPGNIRRIANRGVERKGGSSSAPPVVVVVAVVVAVVVVVIVVIVVRRRNQNVVGRENIFFVYKSRLREAYSSKPADGRDDSRVMLYVTTYSGEHACLLSGYILVHFMRRSEISDMQYEFAIRAYAANNKSRIHGSISFVALFFTDRIPTPNGLFREAEPVKDRKRKVESG